MHEFDPDQGPTGRVEGLEAQPRPRDALHGAMLVFHDIVEIFALTDEERCPVFLVVTFHRRFVGGAPVNRELLWPPMAADRLDQEALGRAFVAVLGQEKVQGLALLVDGPVEIIPLPLDLNENCDKTL